jgi:hypothetical protein
VYSLTTASMLTREFKHWTGTLVACVTRHEVQQSNVYCAVNDVSDA